MHHIRLFTGTLLFWCILIWGGLSLHADDTPQPRLTAYPRVALNDGVRLEAVIPKDTANRRMRLEMDGPLFRAFEEPMEGDRARVIYALTIDRLPEGEYNVTLVILKSDLSRVTKHATFCRGGGCFSEVPQ